MSAVRATALRAGGACVRCRKGKTKCVYENGRAPCKNCNKGMHECYLPSESMSHGGHGVSPARAAHRVREALPSERASGAGAGDPRHGPAHSTAVASRNTAPANEKYVHFPSSPSARHCHCHSSSLSWSLALSFSLSSTIVTLSYAYATISCLLSLRIAFAFATRVQHSLASHHHRCHRRPSPSCFLHLTHLGSHFISCGLLQRDRVRIGPHKPLRALFPTPALRLSLASCVLYPGACDEMDSCLVSLSFLS